MSSNTPQDQFETNLAGLHTELPQLQAKLEHCNGLRALLEKREADLQTEKERVKKEIVKHEEWREWKEKQREMIQEKQRKIEEEEYEEKDEGLWMKDVGRKRTAKKQLERED
jgi:peptidoglycan hydrolase CwlO-like protein